MKTKEPAVYVIPDWHPKLQQLLGDIRGQIGYMTEFGTFRLLGPIHENPKIKVTKYTTKNNGPTLLLTAASGGII